MYCLPPDSQSPVVLVTGASRGIGAATAHCYAQHGWHVYCMSRSGGTSPMDLTGDVTSPSDCHRVVREVLAREGHLDLLICNAGMGISGAVEYTDPVEAHRQMEVNFFGTTLMVQEALPAMRKAGRGRILLVSSVAAIFGIPFQAYYSASKAALNAYAMALRNEVAPHGIAVGCLLPGDVASSFTEARCKEMRGLSDYPRMQHAVAQMEQDERLGQSPLRIARRLYRMGTCRWLPLYSYEGWNYRLLVLADRLLPKSFVTRILRILY